MQRSDKDLNARSFNNAQMRSESATTPLTASPLANDNDSFALHAAFIVCLQLIQPVV